MMSHSNQLSDSPAGRLSSPLFLTVIHTAVFLVCRLIFLLLPESKVGFIYPSGFLANLFLGYGHYVGNEWLFQSSAVRFVVDASCSGTTFFSILTAYAVFSCYRLQLSYAWVLLTYPVTLLANSIRIVSSMELHHRLAALDLSWSNEFAHTALGTVNFLSILIVFHLLITNRRGIE